MALSSTHMRMYLPPTAAEPPVSQFCGEASPPWQSLPPRRTADFIDVGTHFTSAASRRASKELEDRGIVSRYGRRARSMEKEMSTLLTSDEHHSRHATAAAHSSKAPSSRGAPASQTEERPLHLALVGWILLNCASGEVGRPWEHHAASF